MSSGRLTVVTVATDAEHPFMKRMLVPSCANLDLQLVILAPEKWSSFATKKKVLHDYLLTLDDRSLDGLVLFTDAYDTVFIRGEDHIVRHYEQQGKKILFSAERNCWPLGPLGFPLYGQAHAEPRRYLNSGGFIGRAGDILAMQTKYPKSPSSAFPSLGALASHGFDPDRAFAFSDQYWWTLVHLLEESTVGLDRAGVVFDCSGPLFPNLMAREVMAQVRDFDKRGVDADLYIRECQRLTTYFETPSKAAHIHFAGSVTKAVVQAMDDRGELPQWITQVIL